MKRHNVLAAVSAVAILVGTSYGALAGSWSFSKGESSSKVVTVGVQNFFGTPVAFNYQTQNNDSVVRGSGEAAAGAGTTGGAAAGNFDAHILSGNGAAAWGSTSGSSCAGNGCNSNPNVGTP